MPIYEYKCQSCGKRFEKIQKFSDEPLTVHEDCGGAVERLISAPAFHLKGTGWYATDYAKSSGATPAASGDSGEKKADSDSKSSDSKSESKTETGTESKPADSKPATAAESK